jgi:hypothetical protein
MATNSNVAMDMTKKAVKTAIRAKFGVLTLKAKLIIGGIALAAVLLLIFITGLVGVIQGIVGGGSSSDSNSNSITGFGTAQVTAQVQQYRGAISSELEKYGMGEYTDLVLALMQQESGGRGNDPMQASESKCGYIGCITSPSESIEYGVKHFISVLEKANYDIKLTLQSYNFGGGFINFVMNNGGAYTKELAIEFSQNMYNKLKHLGIYKCHRASAIEHGACYGDIEYVDAVLKYLPSAVVDGSIEVMGDEFNIVFSEMKKYEGYSYTFGGAHPTTSFDCSGLMLWAFKKIGVNLPRTAQEQYNSSTKISAADLKPGDFIFFTGTYNAGRPVTHVGMYVGNGMMFDANSGGVGFTDINTSYWKSHLYGYGRIVDFK